MRLSPSTPSPRFARRLAALALIAGLVVPLARAQEAMVSTDDAIIIAPHANHVVILPRHRPPGPMVPMPVRVASVSTHVAIDDQVASTTLVMTLQNPGGGQREAVVMVPVPEGASIRSFGIDGMGSEPTAKLLPKDEARRIYESIVRRSRDPGLLEFVGYSVIRTSVFPVPPGGTQTVRLTYETLLPAERGTGSSGADRVDYVLPRSETISSEAGGAGTAWSLSLDLKAKRPISTVYSPSHEITTERIDEKHVRVKTLASAASAPGSFRLSYLLAAEKEGLTATVMAYPDPSLSEVGGGYFMLLAGLPAQPAGSRPRTKREVTVVIDRSGSMRNEKMKQAREAALQVLEGLHDGERFNIIDYSDSIASFEERTVVKDDESMKRARAYLKGIQANGGTNIHDALLEALRQEANPGLMPVVLFLTDGLPTVGQTGEGTIREAAKGANKAGRRIFSFGVGYDVNGPLLTGIARASRGASTFVLPEEDVEAKVGQVFRRLSGPVMSTPKLGLVKRDDGVAQPVRLSELQPRELPDLFDGDQLVVLGQYRGHEPMTVRLSGEYLGKDKTFEVSFDPNKATVRNAFVGRLWAARKIGSLLEDIRLASADANASANNPRTKELVDEVVRLSLKWGIMTEYTAFLAVEAGSPLAMSNERLYAPAAPGRAAAKAADNVAERAVRSRTGKEAVSQEVNLAYQTAATNVQAQREFLDKDMQRVKLAGVQQVQDRALFRRSNRWVEGALLKDEAEAPERTVEFASAEYFQLADELASQHRQGILAQQGEVYLLHNGKRVLVKGGE